MDMVRIVWKPVLWFWARARLVRWASRRVRHHHLMTGTCRDINIVVSNGYIGDYFEVWALRKDGLVNPVREENNRTRPVPEFLYQNICRIRNICLVILNLRMLFDKGDRLGEYSTRD
jgi:hypothetical protein